MESAKKVYTNKVIVFSNHNDQDVVDIIPLEAIVNIKKVDIVSDRVGSQQTDPDIEANNCILQIETHPESYNSGQTYQLRARSAMDLRHMVEDMTILSQKAIDRAEAKTNFRKTQEKIARIFDSDITQSFFAFLIFAVNRKSTFSAQGYEPEFAMTEFFCKCLGVSISWFPTTAVRIP